LEQFQDGISHGEHQQHEERSLKNLTRPKRPFPEKKEAAKPKQYNFNSLAEKLGRRRTQN